MRIRCTSIEKSLPGGRELARAEVEIQGVEINAVFDVRVIDGNSDIVAAMPSTRWKGAWKRPVDFLDKDLWARIEEVATEAFRELEPDHEV